MKKQTLLVIFYILYFSWLLTVTYLTNETMILNYFTAIVILFYLVFLREKNDVYLFILVSIVTLLGANSAFSEWPLNIDVERIVNTPPWLPIAWGTTVLALRKLYIVVLEG